MSSRQQRVLVGLLALCGSTLAAGDHAPRVRPFVSPVDEITILDPGTNPEGKPSPVLYTGADHQPRIDVPPTVIVHNYYYTGDRNFRGPVFRGGPSIVVVNHPLTGERQYLEVQMLPGSPRITYTKSYIDYDFGERQVRLRLLHPLKPCDRDTPTVTYSRGRGFAESTQSTVVTCGQHTRDWICRTGVPTAVGAVAHASRNAINSSADIAHDVGAAAAAPFVRVAEATPLGSLLTADPEESARRTRDAAVQRAARNNSDREFSIPTLR